MEKEELTQEKLDRVNDIVLKLVEVFVEEGNKCNSSELMLFALGWFNAGILSAYEIKMGKKDQIDVFLKIIREGMEGFMKEEEKEISKEEQSADDVVN